MRPPEKVMMSTTDRRAALVDAAIDVIATQGIRALTHRALDTALELPGGSASYYFRTKRALIEAIADRITTRSATTSPPQNSPRRHPSTPMTSRRP